MRLELGQAFIRRAVQELPDLHPIDALGRYQVPPHEVVVVGQGRIERNPWKGR